MERTQIYLGKSELAVLRRLSKATGKNRSQLIREAIDQYQQREQTREATLRALRLSAGGWKRRDTGEAALLERHAEAGDELWSAAVVRTEVLAGQRRGEEARTLALFSALRWCPVTVEVADLAGSLAARYLRSHSGVDTVDYLLAATAAILEAELLTQNVKHFPMIPALRPAYR